MNKEKLRKLEEKIRNEHLYDIYIKVIKLFILSIIGAVIGYFICKYNQYPIINWIILGIACPWGYMVVDKASEALNSAIDDLYILVCLITFGLYAIVWFIIKLIISAFVGLVAGPIIAIYYVVEIKRICKADYTDWARSRYYSEYPEEKNYNYIKKDLNNPKEDSHLHLNKDRNEQYHCEMCLKEISKEDYDAYECLCEECYMAIHTDENGNFREDYYKY